MRILSVKLKSVIITALVIIAVALGIFFTASTLSDAVSAEARMIPIYNVGTTENKVAVTFNCAVGNSDMDDILATLNEYSVKATFFLLGSWANDYIEEVQKIYDAGHENGWKWLYIGLFSQQLYCLKRKSQNRYEDKI